MTDKIVICVFCFQGKDNPKPYCPDNPGEGCSYGLHHEFPGDLSFGPAKKPIKQPVKKVDKLICTKCAVHSKNPISQTNGCAHEYPD